MAEVVLTEMLDDIGVVTMNRPEAHNAVDRALSDGLRAAFDWIEQEETIRVGVLCAAGRSFCAGMDLKAFAAGEGDAILNGRDGFGGLVRRRRNKPLIAAVGGAALAGGFELTLACDMIVAAPGARFGLPEPKRGLIAGAGGTFRLANRVPTAKAAEILLTGRVFDRDEAETLGLISRSTEAADPKPEALALARDITACAPMPVSAILSLLHGMGQADETALWHESDRVFAPIAASEDAHEGALAFAEKRAAQWRGR